MESYFAALGVVPHPQHSKCRKMLTKVAALITVLDDVYDVYGTPQELHLFTDAVERFASLIYQKINLRNEII